MKIVITGFADTMTRPQRKAGYIYLPFYIIVLPLFVVMLSALSPENYNDLTANAVYYGIGLLFCLIPMRSYLRSAYDALLDNLGANIAALAFGYIINILLGYLATGLIFTIMGDKLTSLNSQLSAFESSRGVIALAVFVAPVIEEVLFRGVVFGALAPKHRRLAFIVSIGLFAFYNVWQFAIAAMNLTVFVYMIAYIPLGYVLAWAYEKTNCIWVSILLHILINAMSLLVVS
ncbi:MAG: CPBP family intramembrane metalloprotease [Clostridia bacterium]|nr:CPBP family intramembrane metalloprotease [Clostridia bacterium]